MAGHRKFSELVRESEIEAYLVSSVRKMGGMALKFVSPGQVGVPDRIVLLPERPPIFVEVKAPDGVLSAVQNVTLERMSAAGAIVCVVFNKGDVDHLLKNL